MAFVSQTSDMIKQVDEYIHQENTVGKCFDIVEKKTNIPRKNLLRGCLVFTAVWLVVGYGSKLLCHLIGFAYPAYASVLAIESPSTDDDTRWLIYWVVFGLFCCLEFFFDIILFWFPLYNLVKCAFLIWCFIPTTYNGTSTIYYGVVRPYFLKYEQDIDDKISMATEMFSNTAKGIASKATEVIEDTKTQREESGTWNNEEADGKAPAPKETEEATATHEEAGNAREVENADKNKDL